MYDNSCYSTSLPAFGVVSVPNIGHSNKCVVLFHSLNLHFPDDIQIRASFNMIITIKSSLVKCPIKVFGTLFLKLGCLFSDH